MKKRIRKFIGEAGEFLLKNFASLILYLFLISIAAYFKIRIDESMGFSERAMLKSMIEGFPVATFLMILRGLILRKRPMWRRLAAGTLTTLVALCSFSEIWLIFIMRTRWTDRIMRLFLNTNTTEAGEFLNGAFFTFKSLCVTACFIVGFILLWAGMKFIASRLCSLKTQRLRRIVKISLATILIGGNIASVFVDATEENSTNTLYRLRTVIGTYLALAEHVKGLEESIHLADGIMDKEQEHPARIIWVLGESDSPYHSQLYGYPRPTTPFLLKESQAGNVLTFKDVICYEPSTLTMLDILFRLTLCTDSEYAKSHTPLVTMIMRKAGYKVRLFDNQSTLTNGNSVYEIGGQCFMNSWKLSKANFDYRNDKMDFFDGDFLRRETPELKKRNPFTLDIIHLKGQHADAVSRYPKSFSFFTEKDYSDRRDLGERERKYIAEYDNATRYLDASLSYIYNLVKDEDAVIVYISDHGELMCEEDDKYWRLYVTPPNPRYVPHYQSIPMYVMTTPEFRRLHPALYLQLEKAQDKKFSTIYFSHFLLDLAGVESRYKRSELSPVSESWSNPPRLTETVGDYDRWLENLKK